MLQRVAVYWLNELRLCGQFHFLKPANIRKQLQKQTVNRSKDPERNQKFYDA